MVIRWLGHFSRIAELGICALFCFTILTFCFFKPLPQRTLPAAHALSPLKKEEAVFPYHAGNTASFCFAAAAESKMHF